MRIGVAMAMYNGEKYILRQLDSVLGQTQPPDTIVICDDVSTDGSVRAVCAYAADHPMGDRIQLAQNARNLGYAQNFYRAVSLCHADHIYLADQDDVWMPEKIARMEEAFARDGSIQLLACGHMLIDAEGRPLRSVRYGTRAGGGSIRKVSENEVVSAFQWPGMCMAFSAEFWNQAEPMAKQVSAPHDRVLALLAASFGGLAYLDLPLACHRLHTANAGGDERRAGVYLQRAFKEKELTTSLAWLDAQIAHGEYFSPAAREGLERYREYLAIRRTAVTERRPKLLLDAWRHGRGCRNLRGLAADLAAICKR